METSFIYDRFVSGKDFWGRQSEVNSLSGILMDGGNAALYEPAKTGVNSLVRETLMEMKMEGVSFVTVECSFLGIRTLGDLTKRLSTSLLNVFTSTPREREEFSRKYLPAGFPHESPEGYKMLLEAPYSISRDKKIMLVMVLKEFQDILSIPDGERRLKFFDSSISSHDKDKEVGASKCCFIFCGTQVNAMKYIFEEKKYFFKRISHVKLRRAELKDVENNVIKRFLSSGKVIENEEVNEIYTVFRGNLWYINRCCAVCDAMSRGYVNTSVVRESITSILRIHEPAFVSAMHSLTTFQISFLKAVIDAETHFSSERVISLYGLNSSANVRRIKDALCKKEIITFDDSDHAVILDPLFEYWLRTFYFLAR